MSNAAATEAVYAILRVQYGPGVTEVAKRCADAALNATAPSAPGSGWAGIRDEPEPGSFKAAITAAKASAGYTAAPESELRRLPELEKLLGDILATFKPNAKGGYRAYTGTAQMDEWRNVAASE